MQSGVHCTVTWLLYVLSSYSAVNGFGGSPYYFPSQCQHFLDTRAHPMKEDSRTEIIIPSHLTNGRDKELRFLMESGDGVYSSALEYEKACKAPKWLRINVTLEAPEEVFNNKYSLQETGKSKNDTYFTSDGYLHHMSNFWNVNDYCVESISDTELVLKTCKLDCSADLSKTYLYTTTSNNEKNYSGTSRVCLPKCCGVDEILSVNDYTCRKLNDTEPNYFFPYLRLQTPSKATSMEANNVLVTPHLSPKRATWNATHGLISEEQSVWEELHFFRRNMNCSKFIWKGLQYHDSLPWAGGVGPLRRNNIRIEVAQPQVTLSFLTRSRKWVGTSARFCVDGLDNWGDTESGKEISQVVVWCEDKNSPKIIFNPELEESELESITPMKVIYIITLVLCTIFLFSGFSMYALLRPKLSLYGKIIASHLGCVAFSYGASFIAAVISLNEDARQSSNAVVVVSSDFDGYRRIGNICVGIGVICHYLYLTSYLWLSALNSEAWGELRQWGRKYWIYGIFGWVLPALCLIAFCVVDGFYNDPWSEVIVPDYGVQSCHVASWSAFYYVHCPVGTTILLNMLYIFGKVGKRCYQQCLDKRNIDKGTSGEGPWREAGIPFRLFGIMWRVQAFRWIIDLTETVRQENGQGDNWARTLLLIIAALTETFTMVYFYCVHDTILGLLGERVTRLRDVVRFMKKNMVVKKNALLVECVFEENGNDTVAIEL